ncbi:hypothetical protein V8E55_009192 [Tylopilus felleus]
MLGAITKATQNGTGATDALFRSTAPAQLHNFAQHDAGDAIATVVSMLISQGDCGTHEDVRVLVRPGATHNIKNVVERVELQDDIDDERERPDRSVAEREAVENHASQEDEPIVMLAGSDPRNIDDDTAITVRSEEQPFNELANPLAMGVRMTT